MVLLRVRRALGILLFIGTAAYSACAQEARPEQAVNLLAMGDWGTNARPQKKVAQGLAAYVQTSGREFNAMLLLGDNCYLEPKDQYDGFWTDMFENMYDPAALNFPFYVAFGNHDYTNNVAQFQLDYAKAHPESRWKMPAAYYRLELPSTNPMVTVLMLDSCKDQMKPEAWEAEQTWLKAELAKPRTTGWLICAAHHPFFSNGDHGDNGALRELWGEGFKAAGVDFYLCGHDHDVQHLEVPGWPTSFILAGGGGGKVRPMRADNRGPFSRATLGFADLMFTPTAAKGRIVSGDGKVIHEFVRSREGKVCVTFTTPSDVAIPRTVKSISRPDTETENDSDKNRATQPAVAN